MDQIFIVVDEPWQASNPIVCLHTADIAGVGMACSSSMADWQWCAAASIGGDAECGSLAATA